MDGDGDMTDTTDIGAYEYDPGEMSAALQGGTLMSLQISKECNSALYPFEAPSDAAVGSPSPSDALGLSGPLPRPAWSAATLPS